MSVQRRSLWGRTLIGAGLVALAVAGCNGSADGRRSPSPVTHQTSPVRGTASPDEVADLVAGNNAFAFDLHRRLAGRHAQDNFTFSPYSVRAAAALAYRGAGGETAVQMGKVFHFGLPADRVPAALGDLEHTLVGEGRGLALAAGLWVRKGYPLRPEYLAGVAAAGAAVREVDFAGDAEGARRAVNDWVAGHTGKAITDLLGPDAVRPDTALLLASGVNLKAPWENPFSAGRTAPRPFHGPRGDLQVQMMASTGQLRAHAGPDAKVVELPVQGGMVLDVILPDEKSAGTFEEQTFTAANLEKWVAGLRVQPVQLQLPRFAVSGRADLNGDLASMGMPAAFGNGADFTGMTAEKEGLLLSRVVHRAVVEVNEQGLSAAAATGISLLPKSLPPPGGLEVVVDRPFLFVVRDPRTRAILFLGRVTEPERAG
jgi:serpin B